MSDLTTQSLVDYSAVNERKSGPLGASPTPPRQARPRSSSTSSSAPSSSMGYTSLLPHVLLNMVRNAGYVLWELTGARQRSRGKRGTEFIFDDQKLVAHHEVPPTTIHRIGAELEAMVETVA